MSQPCPYCGNLDFEEENGVLVCTSCGRQQEGGLQVADDDAEFGTQGKVARRKIERTKIKVTKTYRGARAYKLYLQAWQHILWRQTHALIHGSAKTPTQLWTVVRDLWTLKLSTLIHRLDERTKDRSDQESTTNAESYASSTGDEDETQDRTRHHLSPKLWDTISLIYLAAILIRHPIPLSRMYTLIRSEEIPFIRAIRFVPYEMTSHLPPEYQLALDTISIPQPEELQNAAFRLVQSFASTFGMEVPALNWKLLLYEWIVELGLPLEIYETVKDLSKLVNYDFTYQITVYQQSDPDLEVKSRKKRRTPVAMPELQLMSLIIVATKLLFPFPTNAPTKRNRENKVPDEHTYPSLTNLTLDWPLWLSIHKSHLTSPDGPAKHITTTDRDVAKMSPEDMDDYITWYQRTFSTPDSILRQKKTDLEMSILDLFPLPDVTETTTGDTREQPPPPKPSQERQHTAEFPPTSHQPPSNPAQTRCKEIQSKALRFSSTPIQQAYIIFTSLDALTSTSTIATTTNIPSRPDSQQNHESPIVYFHELAASTACIDLKTLFRAVRYTEGRLEDWIRERRRVRLFEEE